MYLQPMLVIRLGFFLSTLAFLYGFYIVFRKMVFGAPIVGWASLMVSVYFLSGIIISILGIVAIYLGKTFLSTVFWIIGGYVYQIERRRNHQ